MAKDDRLYAKFTLDFPDSPKIKPLPLEAKWALVEMICYCRRMRTDGYLSKPLAIAMWGASTCLALASNDPENPSLVETENGYLIHDYAAHQTTNAEIDALTEKRRAAGQKGGKARAKQVLKQKPGKIKPETETHSLSTDVDKEGAPSRAKPRKRIPNDYMPLRGTIDKIRSEFPAITDPQLKSMHEDFVLYWKGQGRPMADWDATWLRWMRKEAAKVVPDRSTKPAASDAAFARTQALKLVVPDDGRRELE